MQRIAYRAEDAAGFGTARLQTVQVYRGLAALAVTLTHASIATSSFNGGVPPFFQRVFDLGFLGVDFFFVLSGFIILSSHYDDTRDAGSAALYTRKRLLRIFPAYWPIAIGVLSVYWLTPELSRDPGKDISILKSLFLLPVDGEPALVVAWTLVYELLFYAIFLSFFISSRVFLATLTVWVTAILVNQAFGAPAAGTRFPLIMCLLDPIVVEFVIGLGIAWAARNLRLPGGWIALAGIVLLFSTVLAAPNPVAYRLGFAPALGLIILGSVAVERSMPLTMPRSLVQLGDASYALYLIHVPVIAVSARIIAMTGLPVPWWIFLIANIILAIVAALAYHTRVESAVTSYARKMLDRSVLSKA